MKKILTTFILFSSFIYFGCPKPKAQTNPPQTSSPQEMNEVVGLTPQPGRVYPCKTTSDCNSDKFCKNGFCIPGCEDHTNCAVNKLCFVVNGQEKQCKAAAAACMDACSSNSECAQKASYMPNCNEFEMDGCNGKIKMCSG